MDNIGIQKRKVRKIVIDEDRCGDWRIRLYFDKGRCKVYNSKDGVAVVAVRFPVPIQEYYLSAIGVPPIKKGE